MGNNKSYSKHRERIMTLYRIMYEKTDEFNALTMDDILAELSARGINIVAISRSFPRYQKITQF